MPALGLAVIVLVAGVCLALATGGVGGLAVHSTAGTISVADDTGEPGWTVDIPVELTHDDVHGYTIAVAYDAENVSVDGVTGVDLPVDETNITTDSVTFTGAQTAGVDAPTVATLEVTLLGEPGSTTDLVPIEDATVVNNGSTYLEVEALETGTITVRTSPPLYEKEFPADGSVYAVGLPGPVNGTVADAFPEGHDDVTSVYSFGDGTWNRVSDMETEPDALDVLAIVTAETAETVRFDVRLEPETAPSNRTLEAGWNLVPAPAFSTVTYAFGEPLEAILVHDRYDHVESAEYDQPATFGTYVLESEQWGHEPPSASPFAGYFLYMADTGVLEPAITNVTERSDADEQIGLDG